MKDIFTFIVIVIVVLCSSASDAAVFTYSPGPGDGGRESIIDTSCPVDCWCVQLSPDADPPCSWCISDLLYGNAEPQAADADQDAVLCEGCDGGDTGGVDPRGVTTPSWQQLRPEEQLMVTCSEKTAVPFELPVSTTVLDLSDNRLTALEAGFLEFAPTKYVDTVGEDDLDRGKTELEVFDGPRLSNLRLRANMIDCIANGSFRGPSAATIRLLDLSGNQLSEIPAALSALSNTLRSLNLSDNRLTGRLVDGPFNDLWKLTELDLSHNEIDEVKASAFRGLTSLEHLLLAGNRIHVIDSRAFRPLEALINVALNDNPIGHQQIRFQVDNINSVIFILCLTVTFNMLIHLQMFPTLRSLLQEHI